MMAISSLRDRLVRSSLRIYPRRWRERYAEEVLEIVRTDGITKRHLAGLALEGLGERVTGGAAARLDPSPAGHARRFARALIVSFVCSFAMLPVLAAGIVLAGAAYHAYSGIVGQDLPLEFVQWAPRPFAEVWDVAGSPGHVIYFGYSLLFAAPVLVGLMISAVGRRWPRIARVVSVCSFLLFTTWLGGLAHIAMMFGPALAVAILLFPTDVARPEFLGAKVQRR
jgi:hypothetical protein